MKKRVKSSNVFDEKQKLVISQTLINLRELNFLTQTDIAKHLHLSSSTISHYEKGLTVPPTEVLYRLADFYNVTTDYIFGRSASKTDLNETYAMKLTKKMSIGDAVEIMTKMDDTEREHLAYFIEVIGKSKK
ncbi:helix-turn-helix domain-containing protein [Ruminococcus albus]|uniref:Transcriptional regulator, contains XRE-family HTH domain n=1 Tax=Ruminococcus albus TaxID=1264 RepID=A0A1I1SC53_RUMAL|nr:helix-turn-helix transcriptional regulator [Ruminococcus albus]SFD40590.1 Transcriptional regulator, contains XRE-family HTH domain [Ruminococcus albus]